MGRGEDDAGLCLVNALDAGLHVFQELVQTFFAGVGVVAAVVEENDRGLVFLEPTVELFEPGGEGSAAG